MKKLNTQHSAWLTTVNQQVPTLLLLKSQMSPMQTRHPELTLTYDFIWSVTSKSKASRFGVDFHGSPQGLLGSISHAEKKNIRVPLATATWARGTQIPPSETGNPDLLTGHAQPLLRSLSGSSTGRLHVGIEQRLCGQAAGPPWSSFIC